MDDATLEMFETFLEETGEHLTLIEDGLLTLEKDNGNQAIINDIFRGIHSIKGGAGFFDLDKLGNLSHAMEELLNLARQRQLVFESQHVEILLKCLDILKHMIDKPESSNDIDISDELTILRQYIEKANSKEQKTNELKAISAANTTPDFGISAELLMQQHKKGHIVYQLTINVKEHIIDNGDTLANYLDGLKKMGEIIVAKPSIDEALAWQNPTAKDELKIIFATAMDPDLADVIFSLPTEHYHIIESEQANKSVQFLDKNNQLVSITPMEKSIIEPMEDLILSTPHDISPQTASLNKPPEQGIKEEKYQNLDEDDKSIKHIPDLKRQADPILGEQETLRVKIKQLNQLVNLAGELVLSRNQLSSLTEKYLKDSTSFSGIVKNLSIIISELQEQIMNTRMQPIAQICTKFPRIVRDLSKKLNKFVEFQLEGGEIELDKTIIETLTDPLTHLIRNVVDHGIEMPEIREKRSKPRVGTLLLKAFHESGQVIIEVRDDGNGLNADKITEKALEKKLVDRASLAAMSEREKIKLIFSPGFSTADKISDISGRGVGMDVVKTNIEKIGGTVDIDSIFEHGTTIRMTLPLTLAIVSSLIVSVHQQRFILPQVNIEELISIEPENIHKRIGKVQDVTVLKIRGKLLPLVHTSDILGFPPSSSVAVSEKPAASTEQSCIKIIVIRVGIQSIGLIVDEIMGIEEIVVKPMPQFLRHLHFYSGCSILGDGSVALILDLLEVAKNLSVLIDRTAIEQIAAEQETIEAPKTKLVPLLIFNNGTDEQFAVPIALIERIEKFNLKRIQNIGHMEFTEHQSKAMRILRLENHLNIQKPIAANPLEPSIIVIKDSKPLSCLFIHQIIDSKSIEIAIEKDILCKPGISGSILIDHRITVLLDLPSLIEISKTQNISDEVSGVNS